MLAIILSLFGFLNRITGFTDEWGYWLLGGGGLLIAVLVGILVFMRMRRPED